MCRHLSAIRLGERDDSVGLAHRRHLDLYPGVKLSLGVVARNSVFLLGERMERTGAEHGVAAVDAGLESLAHERRLEVGRARREPMPGAGRRLVERRRREPEYASRRVRLHCAVDGECARIVIRDEGPGFDVRSLPDPCDPEYMLRASGRGVLLMRMFMDEVVYNAAGNEVTLIKRRRSDGRAASAPQQACQA